ncbi:MAG: hypothetical protein ACFFBD_21130 [Candidatus Hodarchaeota archaeon]
MSKKSLKKAEDIVDENLAELSKLAEEINQSEPVHESEPNNLIESTAGHTYNSFLEALVDTQIKRDAKHFKTLSDSEKKNYVEEQKKAFNEELNKLIGGEEKIF